MKLLDFNLQFLMFATIKSTTYKVHLTSNINTAPNTTVFFILHPFNYNLNYPVNVFNFAITILFSICKNYF